MLPFMSLAAVKISQYQTQELENVMTNHLVGVISLSPPAFAVWVDKHLLSVDRDAH